MSQYLDHKFMQPQVEQYGSHMVMTNVVKPAKLKHIHLDTKYRDETSSSSPLIDVSFTFPDKITDVRSARIVSAELPFSFYNLTEQECANSTNNVFVFTVNNAYNHPVTNKIVISPGYINYQTILTAANQVFNSLSIAESAITSVNVGSKVSLNYDTTNKQFYFTAVPGYTIAINFAVDAASQNNAMNFKSTIGWSMGFRVPSFTFTGTAPIPNRYAEQTAFFPYPKYFYIAIEDNSRTPNMSVITPTVNGCSMPRNIIAKIVCDTSVGFGNTIVCTESNGRLISDRRFYGKTDLQRIRVQLIDDIGNIVDLNGGELSLTLILEHE